MKKLGFWWIFGILGGLLGAQTLEITVLDGELDSPLEGAKVLMSSGASGVTDEAGKVSLTTPGEGRIQVTVGYPGYETKKVWTGAGEKTLTVKLALTGVVQGKELVVEGRKPEKTDAQAGVSQVLTRQDIRNTAEMGMVEDVMSSIKVLPGVGYVGGWNAAPSIRGGSPEETTSVLDGAYVAYPYHWGGAFSIFNPNMVESAKLSSGLISARYGQVMSGLLEVTSRTPQKTQAELLTGISTTGADLFLLAPLGPQAGVLLGGKITWMEVSMGLAGQGDKFYQFPYIRDGYSRAYWKPTDRLEGFVNTFIGSDGIKSKLESQDQSKSFTTKGHFQWDANVQMLGAGVNWMPSEDQLWTLSGAFNRVFTTLDSYNVTNGTKAYTPDFISTYSGILGGATSFTLSNLENRIQAQADYQTYQGRLNWDLVPFIGQKVTFGAESMVTNLSDSEDVQMWVDSWATGSPLFTQIHPTIQVKNNRSWQSALYGLWNFDFGKGEWAGELGLRVDHATLFNDQYSLQTLPAVNPRARVTWTPVKNQGSLEALGFTLGSGLFSQAGIRSGLFDPKYGFKDWEVSPDRAWFTLLGTQLELQDGWKFSLEGYYKQYFNRMYITMDDRTSTPVYGPHTDGTGYAFGFDLLIQKATSRFLDGWLTYSFSMARFMNPAKPFYDGNTAVVPSGAPLDQWYYPAYHRFHNLNLILTFKPWEGLGITTKAAVATGAPKKSLGNLSTYASAYGSGYVQRYTQTSAYSDDLRNDISCPIDLKITWNGYYPGTKVRWEYYFGVENVLANLYTPKTNKSFDPFTGGEMAGSGEADFTIGMPVPSFGFKISY